MKPQRCRSLQSNMKLFGAQTTRISSGFFPFRLVQFGPCPEPESSQRKADGRKPSMNV